MFLYNFSVNSSMEIFFISHNLLAIIDKYWGSFLFPLKGVGAKYGASVSIRIFSIGTFLITESRPEFLNVKIPPTT